MFRASFTQLFILSADWNQIRSWSHLSIDLVSSLIMCCIKHNSRRCLRRFLTILFASWGLLGRMLIRWSGIIIWMWLCPCCIVGSTTVLFISGTSFIALTNNICNSLSHWTSMWRSYHVWILQENICLLKVIVKLFLNQRLINYTYVIYIWLIV